MEEFKAWQFAFEINWPLGTVWEIVTNEQFFDTLELAPTILYYMYVSSFLGSQYFILKKFTFPENSHFNYLLQFKYLFTWIKLYYSYKLCHATSILKKIFKKCALNFVGGHSKNTLTRAVSFLVPQLSVPYILVKVEIV